MVLMIENQEFQKKLGVLLVQPSSLKMKSYLRTEK